jgi:Holliday junction resolvase
MGAHSRTKGAQAEREVAAIAREHGFESARRSAPMQAGYGSDDDADVENVGRLWLEVKRRGKGSMYALAVDATKERAGWVPTLVYREDRGPWLAVVPLTELLKLERAALPRPEAIVSSPTRRDGGGESDAPGAAEEAP